jgi:transmembrane sensor
MADLLPFRPRRRVEEEASLWLSRMDRGLEAPERAALEAWIARDARHGRALVEMAAVWDDMELLRELSGLLELPPRGRAAPAAGRWAWLAAGAAVPLLLLSLLLLRPESTPAVATSPSGALVDATSSSSTRASPSNGSLGYATRIGEQRTEVLADGSIVKLNTATRIRVTFGAHERRIEVAAGEAHFEVQKDPARPFLVLAAGRQIRAVGTAFNVRLARDGVRVIVTEGQVEVSRAGPAGATDTPAERQATAVAAGEQLVAGDPRTAPWVVQSLAPEALADRLAWQRGMLVFDGERLEDALAEVARYGDVRFAIPDARLRGMRIGGVYKSGDVDGLLRSLERNFDLVVTRGPQGEWVVAER